MTPPLTVGGVVIAVAPGSADRDRLDLVDRARALDGSYKASATGNAKKEWRFTTPPRSLNDAYNYESVLNVVGPQTASGDLIGWVSRASIASYFNVSGVMQFAPINVLRAAHYVGGVLQPPLIEGATTNYAGNSQNLTVGASWNADSSGTGAAPTRTANYAAAPDGTTTATRIQLSKTAGVGFSRVYSITASITSAVYVLSIYLKSTDGVSYYNISLGEKTAGTPRRVISITPAWQRFSLTTPGPVTIPEIELMVWNTTNTSLSADFLAWGAQIE